MQIAPNSDDFLLASFWAESRSLRLSGVPDEIHRASVAKLELKKAREGSLTTERAKSE